MSLTINVDAVENNEELHVTYADGSEGPDSLTCTLAVHMKSIGIPRIAANNYHEFHRRVEQLEILWGPLGCGPHGKPVNITLEDVRRRIGMFTNWEHKTRAQFDREVREERKKQGAG